MAVVQGKWFRSSGSGFRGSVTFRIVRRDSEVPKCLGSAVLSFSYSRSAVVVHLRQALAALAATVDILRLAGP